MSLLVLNLRQDTADMDAGKRFADAVNLHLQAAMASGDLMDAVGQWVAISLADGSSDGNLYPDKETAVFNQHYPKDNGYIKITPDGITPQDALKLLRLMRNPMIDNTAPEHIINPYFFPRFSNLSPAQKRAAQLAEQKALDDRNNRP